jgi:NADP-dependent 3-hydroxy acid dehydrogenase YdfG
MESAVWVTGASAGIGKALAIKFANNSHQVIASARRVELIEKFIEEKKLNGKILAFKNNVAERDEVFSFVSRLQNEFKISCLINNAGISSFKPFVENKISDIEEIIDTNLKGSIYTIKSVLPSMIENNSGVIINILSVVAHKVFTNSSLYAASKTGLQAFSKVLREELRGNNIKIINIYPGATSTEIWPDKVLNTHSEKMMTPKSLANFIYDIYTNSKYISPEEIEVKPITGDL